MINRDRIRRHTIKLFQDRVKILDTEFTATFNDPIFRWPRATVRSTGEIAGSPRNIVDTGKLRDSQTVVINQLYARFTWSAKNGEGQDYAAKVLLGSPGKPGRDWIRATLDRI